MYYFGFDIGGTKCSISVGGDDLSLCEKTIFPTNTQRGPMEVIKEIKQKAALLINKYGHADLNGIGISCGESLDSKKGLIMKKVILFAAVTILLNFFTDVKSFAQEPMEQSGTGSNVWFSKGRFTHLSTGFLPIMLQIYNQARDVFRFNQSEPKYFSGIWLLFFLLKAQYTYQPECADACRRAVLFR